LDWNEPRSSDTESQRVRIQRERERERGGGKGRMQGREKNNVASEGKNKERDHT
jgi:hypothetical protein